MRHPGEILIPPQPQSTWPSSTKPAPVPICPTPASHCSLLAEAERKGQQHRSPGRRGHLDQSPQHREPQLLPGSSPGPGATPSMAASTSATPVSAGPQPRPHLCLWPLHDTLFSHPLQGPSVPGALTPLGWRSGLGAHVLSSRRFWPAPHPPLGLRVPAG